MNKRLAATLVAALLVVSLVGCQNKPVGPVSPFQPAAIDPQAFSKKVDTFVIVMDASETMGDMYQGRRKADIAKDIVAHMNQTIPPYDYRAGAGGLRLGLLPGQQGRQGALRDDHLPPRRPGERARDPQVRGRHQPHERGHRRQ